MRVLFTFAGGRGHYAPTVPLAHALRRRGHQLAYACQEQLVDDLRASGWETFATGGRTMLAPGQRRPLVAADRAAEQRVTREVYAGVIARERAQRLADLIADWRPDVVIRDEMDFGAAVAAEQADLPHAAVTVIAAGGFVSSAGVQSPLDALRREQGLPPDPGLEMLDRYLTIVPVPPSFRDPADPLPVTAHHIRPDEDDASEGPSSAYDGAARWLQQQAEPIVYFTLGTVFHQESGDLFARVTAAIGSLPVSLLVTVGHELDPAELGPQPSHVRIDNFVPQQLTLGACDAVVSHGGSGTVVASLARGLPLVLLPMGADQPWNAARCEALGVGRTLDPVGCQASDIAEAVSDVLEHSAYRDNAARLAEEVRRSPSPSFAAELVEQLAATKSPVVVDEAGSG